MYQTTDFKKGLKIELEGKVYMVVKSEHTNPGKGAAFIKTKLKNLASGAVIERTFKTGVNTKASDPNLDEKEVEYMYGDQSGFYFMDQTSYETIQLSEEQVNKSRFFLVEGIKLTILYHKGFPISMELPNFVDLRVRQTDPGLRGDTSGGGLKKAVLETGFQLNVPLFIKENELIKIDTRTGTYVERARNGEKS